MTSILQGLTKLRFNKDLLKELGLTDETIDALKKEGISRKGLSEGLTAKILQELNLCECCVTSKDKCAECKAKRYIYFRDEQTQKDKGAI